MKMRHIVPKVKAIEDVKNKTIEVVPRDNYEVLQILTNKSVELYKFYNKMAKKNSNKYLDNELRESKYMTNKLFNSESKIVRQNK